ncbi:MAG TPA: hypothetical protein VF823_01795 [Anaerolineales bacterium]
MAVKLLMTWDIMPGREQEYFEFVVRDFIPGLQRLGLEPSDAWFTMYGEKPQIMTSAQMPSLGALTQVLESQEWADLSKLLMDYVEDFNFKIIPARAGFQM